MKRNTEEHDPSDAFSDDENNDGEVDMTNEFAESDETDSPEHSIDVVDVQLDAASRDAGEFPIPATLPLLPIRNTVVFPGTVTPLQINRERSKRVLDMALTGNRLIAVVAQRAAGTQDPGLDDLFRVATACLLLKMLKSPDGSETIIVHGLRRVGIESLTAETRYMEAVVHAHHDPADVTTEQRALVHTIRAAAERMIELSPNIPDEAKGVLNAIERPGGLADFLAANLPLGLVHKQELLETFDVTDRLRKVNLAVAAQLEVVELSHKIQEQVKGQVDKSQREYYLREQMKAIQSELGERGGGTDRVRELRKRVAAADMPPAVLTEANKELERIDHIPEASPEYGMVLDYLDWLAELPWAVSTEDHLDLHRAQEILDEDHYGLAKIKKRILEFIAVRSLRRHAHGSILCFAGPPGVGKTSLGQSIARAMGRKFIRVSLGGIRDEATIRGHRRTYIGSMPGRIIREIRRAGSNNPLFMLDEVDKIGGDVRGDPMSALLEVLDPAQNSTFSDHYLGVPFDLSKVLFIATANYMAAIEPALRDRMEIIELSGYTQHEKLHIARRHLFPRQLTENGLTADKLTLDDEVIQTIIADYTREAGVRTLERKIAAICRARAAAHVRGDALVPAVTDDEVRAVLGPKEFDSELAAELAKPGVVTGLAYTPTGGEILFVEATMMPGNGQLTLTGQLGDVMRESAIAASSIIRSRARHLNIPAQLLRTHDVHVHVPSGAVPKDGPSAGVTMLIALVSIATGAKVDPRTGMTGEITLSGRVLPIGGVREKVLAAHRAGLKRVILPARNEQDLDDVPKDIREDIQFVFVRTIDELLRVLWPSRLKKTRKRTLKRRARPVSARGKRTGRVNGRSAKRLVASSPRVR